MPGVFGISNGCTVPALGFLKARSRSARSSNFLLVLLLWVCVLFVFRRIYSHVKQVLFFWTRNVTIFFLEDPRSKGLYLVHTLRLAIREVQLIPISPQYA
jgi:hypothetical protein